jgi:hypothetical protein
MPSRSANAAALSSSDVRSAFRSWPNVNRPPFSDSKNAMVSLLRFDSAEVFFVERYMMLLVLMIADVLDQDEFNEPVILNNVNCSIAATESNRAMAFPVTLQWFIVKTRKPSDSLKTIELNRTNPSHEVLDNMARTLTQVLLGARGKSDRFDHDATIAWPGTDVNL